jgi:hypothetical protein
VLGVSTAAVESSAPLEGSQAQAPRVEARTSAVRVAGMSLGIVFPGRDG